MISVDLLHSATDSERIISFAAKSCYNPELPEWDGTLIDIEKRIWNTGHHSTTQHAQSTYTFVIEGIAVGDVTFGLHLNHPFYSSSQRSGRFCGAMFKNPNFDQMRCYVGSIWHELQLDSEKKAMSFIKFGYEIYNKNIENTTELARQLIKKERPNASEKYIEINAPKIAQEQLRMFISTIFPTALCYTIDLSALAALYHVAWSPTLKLVTQKMADLVLRECPNLKYVFSRGSDYENIFEVILWGNYPAKTLYKPRLELLAHSESNQILYAPEAEDLHPCDTTRFNPFLMEGNISNFKTLVGVSLATLGQDQRHRTIGRSLPEFTGNFYLPPIPKKMGLEKEALQLMSTWLGLKTGGLPKSLICVMAPYGAMVQYKKNSIFNAAVHELSKRLCWSAQEEIYHLARQLRTGLVKKTNEENNLIKLMSPGCINSGKCAEGVRYCGRDLTRLEKDPFPEREI